jgi:deoxyhypusine synthase
MDKKNNPNNITHNKKFLLRNPVEHIDIKSFDARKIIDGMGKMSFTSRDTARAAGIYNEMLADKDCSIFLTLAGSTSADIIKVPNSKMILFLERTILIEFMILTLMKKSFRHVIKLYVK